MGSEKLTDVILSTLGFNASLVALLIGAQGYILGRSWIDESKTGSSRSLLVVLFGFALAAYSLYRVASDYLGLTRAITHQSTVAFAADWMNDYWRFYVLLGVAVLFTGVGAALIRKK